MVDRSLLRAYRCRAAEVEAAGGDNLRKNTWYSLTIGPVHISVLDTEADGDAFQEQIDRPEADPAEARADGGGWLFISMHRPIWATATGSENPQWASELLPIIAGTTLLMGRHPGGAGLPIYPRFSNTSRS